MEESFAAAVIYGVDMQVEKVAAAAVCTFVYHVECRWRDLLKAGPDGAVGDVSRSVSRCVCVYEKKRDCGGYGQCVDMSNRNLQVLARFSFVCVRPVSGLIAYRQHYAVRAVRKPLGRTLPDTKIENKTENDQYYGSFWLFLLRKPAGFGCNFISLYQI